MEFLKLTKTTAELSYTYDKYQKTRTYIDVKTKVWKRKIFFDKADVGNWCGDIECPQSQILIEEIYLTGTLIQPLAKPMAKITKGVDMPNMIM